MKILNIQHDKLLSLRRSALSLLFAVLWMLIPLTQVEASSVGASGTFAGTTYQVIPGDSLLNTGTDFVFVNNFNTTITVEFLYEAPTGVSINVPSEPVQISAGSTYRIDIEITTLASTQVGEFPLRIVGRVIPSSSDAVEVTGSAGLNASIRVQGTARTTAPTLSVLSVSDSGFSVRIANSDPETVTMVYSLGISPPVTGSVDIPSQGFVDVDFPNLDSNTTYTLFATSTASPRQESTISQIQVTTLVTPVPDPDPTPSDPETEEPAPPPPVVAPTQPPSFGGGGGSPVISLLFIELESQSIDINVFSEYTPPTMTAYVSIRDNVRETSRVDLTSRVIITGTVDPNILGRYEIRYFLRYNTLSIEEIVVVNVRDLIAPRILSAAENTIKVDEPFDYRLITTDNYNSPEELIITGFPSNVDTTEVGIQRYNVIVADQSGNRTPFLFTVNIRERVVTPITLEVNDIEVTFEAVEGLFNADDYRVEVAVAVNQPLTNSPSWTQFNGQTLEATGQELVYVRLTDNQGNVLLGVLDITTGRVLPVIPDENIITGDPWWRVLLRFSNILVWIVPVIILLAGWIWFFFFLAKRRKKQEEEVEPVVKSVGEKSRKADTVIPSISEVVQPLVETKPKTDKLVPPKKKAKLDEVEANLEPLIQESVQSAKPVAAAKTKPVVVEKASKPTRKRRKPKQEVYAQVVALEQEGMMDDDLLGLEVLTTSKKPIKEVLPEEPSVEPAPTLVDEKQIDMFSEIGEEQPKPKRKKKDS